MDNKEIILKVKDLSHASSCKTHNHRIIDYFHFFSYEFKSQHIYGVINSFGSGGQTLISVLAGYEKNYQGEIYLNNRKVSHKELKNITCCIESNPQYIKRNFFRKNSVISYLNKAIKNNMNFNDSLENVIKVFGLSRLNHDIRYTSGEQWRIILAYGYCMGKKVFLFNWLNYWNLRFFLEEYKILLNYLKDKGCIVIIPTDKTEGIENLFDKIVHISNNLEGQLIQSRI